MNCKHCGARTGEDGARCARCGRKPDDSLNDALLVPRSKSALAPKLEFHPADDSAEIVSPRAAVQRQLFASNPSPKVVAISDAGQAARPARAPQTAQRRTATKSPRTKPAPSAQTSLPFLPTAPPKPRTLSTTVDAV